VTAVARCPLLMERLGTTKVLATGEWPPVDGLPTLGRMDRGDMDVGSRHQSTAANLWRLGVGLAALLGGWSLLGAEVAAAVAAHDELSGLTQTLLLIDAAAGHLAVLVFLLADGRRPNAPWLGLVGVLTTVSAFAAAPVLMWLASGVARTQRARIRVGAVVGFGLVSHELVVRPQVVGSSAGASTWLEVITASAVVTAAMLAVGWGIGGRREQLISYRLRAERAQREQAARIAAANVAERNRIARDMHDAFGHRLSVVALHAAALADRPDLPRDVRVETGRVVHAAVHQALEELRSMLGSLRSPGLAELAAPQSLTDVRDLVEEARRHGQVVLLHGPGGADEWATPVPPVVAAQVYRIVQEALTNARKHAAGAVVEVRLTETVLGQLHLVVTNPSPPPTPEQSSHRRPGYGLVGMAERAALAGGTLSAGQRDGVFVVEALLPLERVAAART